MAGIDILLVDRGAVLVDIIEIGKGFMQNSEVPAFHHHPFKRSRYRSGMGPQRNNWVHWFHRFRVQGWQIIGNDVQEVKALSRQRARRGSRLKYSLTDRLEFG
jgi:hypothetical protein